MNKYGVVEDNKRYALYGAGGFLGTMFSALRTLNICPEFIVDRSKKGFYEDVPIIHPDDVACEDRANITIIMSVFNHYFDIGLIQKKLQCCGYKEVINPVEFSLRSGCTLEFFWLSESPCEEPPESAIRGIFEDEQSKTLFDDIVKFRKTGAYSETISNPDAEGAYCHPVLTRWNDGRNISYIDCGAYNGDSIRQLLDAGNKFRNIIAFEPDQKNFVELQKYLRDESRIDFLNTAIVTVCGGANKETGEVNFFGEGHSAKIGSTGKSVRCYAIDDVCLSNVDLIKLDVEGAEKDVLSGALNTIRLYRPNIAVSVYHRPEDIYEIPLMIANWQLGYKLYLGLHGYNAMDLVLYAVQG